MKVNSASVIKMPVSALGGMNVVFPVRRSGDDGSEFVMVDEWGADLDHAQQRVRAGAGSSWDKANPVARFARVKLVAVEVE